MAKKTVKIPTTAELRKTEQKLARQAENRAPLMEHVHYDSTTGSVMAASSSRVLPLKKCSQDFTIPPPTHPKLLPLNEDSMQRVQNEELDGKSTPSEPPLKSSGEKPYQVNFNDSSNSSHFTAGCHNKIVDICSSFPKNSILLSRHTRRLPSTRTMFHLFV